MCDPHAFHAPPVAALHAFYQAVTDRGRRLRTWKIEVDPCGAPNCSFPYIPPTSSPGGNAGNPMQLVSAHEAMLDPPVVCNYFGITCANWRVSKIILPCTSMDSGTDGFLGQLPEYLFNMDALTVLDLEVRCLAVLAGADMQGSTGTVHRVTLCSLVPDCGHLTGRPSHVLGAASMP